LQSRKARIREQMKTYEKIDDNTVEATETFDLPEPVVVEYNKAELQTELDHIPDRKAEAQEQFDAIIEREEELKDMLKVFD